MLDADRFLTLNSRLRAVHERVDGSELPDHRRSSWSRRMAAIADTATRNLDSAERQLERLEADLDRHLPT